MQRVQANPELITSQGRLEESAISERITRKHYSIAAGDILIRSTTRLPPAFPFSFEEYGDWKKLLHASGYDVERAATRAGWRFSFITPGVEVESLGVQRHSAIDRATKKVMEKVAGCGFNSLEIAQVSDHSIPGLHHVKVAAHPRHLWPSPYLRAPARDHISKNIWEFLPIFWKQADILPEVKGI